MKIIFKRLLFALLVLVLSPMILVVSLTNSAFSLYEALGNIILGRS
jgi:hypothetical protein